MVEKLKEFSLIPDRIMSLKHRLTHYKTKGVRNRLRFSDLFIGWGMSILKKKWLDRMGYK